MILEKRTIDEIRLYQKIEAFKGLNLEIWAHFAHNASLCLRNRDQNNTAIKHRACARGSILGGCSPIFSAKFEWRT